MFNRLKIMKLVVLIVILTVISLPSVWAHDYTIPGGTPPQGPPGPNEPKEPPCDPTPPDKCPLNEGATTNDKKSCTGGEPVYLFDGSFYYRHTDLTIPGNIPISIRRAYDTKSEFKGLMGYGWSMNYHVRLFNLSNGSLLLKHGDNFKTEFIPQSGGTYISQDGYETITLNPDGTYVFARPGSYNYVFDIDGCLETIQDKNGNQLLFRYYSDSNNVKFLVPFSGVSPYATISTPITLGYDYQLNRIDEAHNGTPTGRYTEFFYNANGRITTVRDSTGRQVTYQYDPNETGDLLAMTDPEGNTYEYTYYPSHLMLSFVGMGCSDCSKHTTVYDSQNRVVRQTHGNRITEIEYSKVDVGWEFNAEGNAEGWTPQSGLSSFTVSGGFLRTHYNGGNPYMYGPTISLPARTEHTVNIRYSVTGTSVAQLYWTTSTGGWSDARHIDFSVNADGQFHSYTIDVGSHPQWTGTITQIRLDPAVNGASGDVNIDWIRIGGDPNLSSFDTKVATTVYDDETLKPLNTRYEYYKFNGDGYTTEYARQAGTELDEKPGSTEDDDVVTQYSYDSKGNLVQTISPNGVQTNYTYDAAGNLLTETVHIPDSNDSVVTTYTYEPNHSSYTSKTISSTLKSQIYRSEYTYDANGNIATETIFADINDTNTAMVTRYTYDARGNTLTTTDPMGNVTANGYDANGFLTRVYDPNDPNRQTLYTYDARGNMRSTTDARGNTTTYEYDDLGRVTKITDPLGNMTVNTYGGANLVQIEEGKTVTEAGRISVFEYDGLNRRTAVKKLDGPNEITLFTYAYDSESRVLRTTDGNDKTTTNTYDELGRLVAVTDPNGFTTTFAYEPAGNVIQTTDAENHSTHYSYDYADRLTDVTDALGSTVKYTHNSLGNILTVTDAKGHTTTHTYDGAGRLMQVVDPCGHTTQYAYDKNGNMIKKITPNEYSDPCGADPIVYTYDRHNQLIGVNYPDGKIVIFSYDRAGNMTGWSDGTLSGSTVYDQLNRPLQITTNYPGFSKTINYTYNRFGQRQTMTDGQGQITTYAYDAFGRLTAIAHPGSLTTQYTYDTAGRPIEKILPNSVKTTYTYDTAGRLKQLVNAKAGGSIISSFAYTHDKVGNRLTMTTTQGTHNYGYDNIYQLTSATHPSQPAEVYTYDAVGNRLISAAYNNWAYDKCNRLLSYDGITFTYDASGNTKSKIDASGTTTYGYDYENRMVSAVTPSHTASYAYDPSGKRLRKMVDAVTAYFLYDNEDIIGEYDSSGTLTAKYYHGQGIDEPIAMIRSGTTYYYTFDGLGSVSELTSAAGFVAEGYAYDAFGNRDVLPAITNPYTFTSREYDTQITLCFYRARYYDSTIGRFISPDPLGFDQGTNYYSYVHNNPLNVADPLGLGACGIGWMEKVEIFDRPGLFGLFVSFTEPCQKHDRCCACGGNYLKCNPLFLQDMLKQCNKIPILLFPFRTECYVRAVEYASIAFICVPNENDCKCKR